MLNFKNKSNAALWLLVGMAAFSLINFAKPSSEPGVISVSAQVELEKVPEVAQVRIGFESEVLEDQKLAYDQAAEFASRFNNFLDEANVSSQEYKLQNVSVRKEYIPRNLELKKDVFRAVVGFEVKMGPDSEASVDISEVISESVRLGANNVGSLNYTFEDDDIFNAKLREMASDKILEQADEIADLYGVRRGDLRSYNEHGFGGGPIFMSATREMAMDSAVSMTKNIELNPGTQTVSLDVSATFEIK